MVLFLGLIIVFGSAFLYVVFGFFVCSFSCGFFVCRLGSCRLCLLCVFLFGAIACDSVVVSFLFVLLAFLFFLFSGVLGVLLGCGLVFVCFVVLSCVLGWVFLFLL